MSGGCFDTISAAIFVNKQINWPGNGTIILYIRRDPHLLIYALHLRRGMLQGIRA